MHGRGKNGRQINWLDNFDEGDSPEAIAHEVTQICTATLLRSKSRGYSFRLLHYVGSLSEAPTRFDFSCIHPELDPSVSGQGEGDGLNAQILAQNQFLVNKIVSIASDALAKQGDVIERLSTKVQETLSWQEHAMRTRLDAEREERIEAARSKNFAELIGMLKDAVPVALAQLGENGQTKNQLYPEDATMQLKDTYQTLRASLSVEQRKIMESEPALKPFLTLNPTEDEICTMCANALQSKNVERIVSNALQQHQRGIVQQLFLRAGDYARRRASTESIAKGQREQQSSSEK